MIGSVSRARRLGRPSVGGHRSGHEVRYCGGTRQAGCHRRGPVFALGALVRGGRAAWATPLSKRGVASLIALVLLVAAMEVTEDALGGESGPIRPGGVIVYPPARSGHADRVLRSGVIYRVGKLGSLRLTIVTTIAFLLAGRRFQALLLATSVTSSAIVVYAIKTISGRALAVLWTTDWYWGSSFPSGHTLVVTAFATAASICVGRMWPAGHKVALSAAFLWISLIALSRLVLGVHWPTDVLAAACMGAMSTPGDGRGARAAARLTLRAGRRVFASTSSPGIKHLAACPCAGGQTLGVRTPILNSTTGYVVRCVTERFQDTIEETS